LAGLHSDGWCLGLSALYALCCLPKQPAQTTEPFPKLSLLASVEKMKGVGSAVYPYLSQEWFWENYNNLMCGVSLKKFSPEKRAHLSMFANLIHYLDSIDAQPSQEVVDYLGFPVKVIDQVHFWKLKEKNIKNLLENNMKTGYPFVFSAHEHAVCLKGIDKKMLYFMILMKESSDCLEQILFWKDGQKDVILQNMKMKII